jgi:hypothetical protein
MVDRKGMTLHIVPCALLSTLRCLLSAVRCLLCAVLSAVSLSPLIHVSPLAGLLKGLAFYLPPSWAYSNTGRGTVTHAHDLR